MLFDTPLSQRNSINAKPSAIQTKAIQQKLSTNTAPSSSTHTWDTYNHDEMMKKQKTMDKEDLAPDWVWEYGIMG